MCPSLGLENDLFVTWGGSTVLTLYWSEGGGPSPSQSSSERPRRPPPRDGLDLTL